MSKGLRFWGVGGEELQEEASLEHAPAQVLNTPTTWPGQVSPPGRDVIGMILSGRFKTSLPQVES